MARHGARAEVRSTRTRTRLDPEVRREQIVDAAERVLADRDPTEVTFEQLAEAAGVSRALVYNYFGDKGGVVAAVYLRNFERLDADLDRRVLDTTSSSDRLRGIVEAYLQFAAANPGAWKLIGIAEAGDHPQVQRARQQRYARMATAWGDTADARLLARAIVGFLETVTFDWLQTREVDMARATDVIHAQLWAGLSGLESRAAVTPA